MDISLPPDTQLEEAGIRYFLSLRISLVAKLVKNPPAMLEKTLGSPLDSKEIKPVSQF